MMFKGMGYWVNNGGGGWSKVWVIGLGHGQKYVLMMVNGKG